MWFDDIWWYLMRHVEICISGLWDDGTLQDWSYLASDSPRRKQLDDTKLSRLVMHYVVSRTDTTKHTYCVCMVPRKPKAGGKLEVLAEYGKILEAATQSNGQTPPLGGAWDNAGSNLYINEAFLGRLDQKTLRKAAFFKDCELKLIMLPCMQLYGALWHLIISYNIF